VEALVIRSSTRPLLLLGALLLLAGCATVPMESAQEEARGKQFSPPPPDKGSLYVFRRGFMGAVVTIPVTIAGGMQTQLAQNTWVWLEPAPATIDIKCTGSEGGAELAVNVGPGEMRFVEVAFRPGLLGGRCAVTEVPEAQGRGAVLAGRRAVGP
jgi:starvation-inducible outer membrane lipoprotein